MKYKNMSKYISRFKIALRFALIVVLFGIFFLSFFEPSYRKLYNNDVLAIKSVDKPAIQVSPAITICPGEV